MTKHRMSAKEYDTWQQWLKEAEETAVKPARRRGVPVGLWLVLALLIGLLGLALMGVTKRPYNAVYIVATATPETHYIRFLCFHNNGRMLPNMGVTWQRENGQTVDDVTDAVGCVMVPANETIGVLNHVHQVMVTVWPGARPVCQDITTGIIESGNLCPPGQ